jgi:hypothetical protein
MTYKRNAPFVWIGTDCGIAQKGTYCDASTLYVGTPKIAFSQIEVLLKKNAVIKKIYFGAGKSFKINHRVVSMLLSKYKDYPITLEVHYCNLATIPKSTIRRVSLVIVISKREFVLLKNMPAENIRVRLQSFKGNDDVMIMMKGLQSTEKKVLREKLHIDEKVLS